MKQRIFIFALALFFVGHSFISAQDLSGVFDSTVNYTAGAGDFPDHSWGIEEYANLRLRLRPKDNVILNAAFNLFALSGNYAIPAIGTGVMYGQNYAAGMELERLFFRINGDLFDTEAGLLRMNFGYGQVWGSSDFLNPRNPLFPNARPRGVIGMNVSFYPADTLKFTVFAAAPKNPLEAEGHGFIPGISLDQHFDRASIQVLYAYETPKGSDEPHGSAEPPGSTEPPVSSSFGIHRFGLSLKADLELGFVADALYTLNPDKLDGVKGLSAGAGFDYNFLSGDLYLLFEYLFNGSSSISAPVYGGTWKNNHYLYGTMLYRFNDFTSLALSAVLCFDDLSFSPFLTLNYEVFQGFSLNLVTRFAFDRKSFSRGEAGELGPCHPLPDGGEGGARVIVNAGARLRF